MNSKSATCSILRAIPLYQPNEDVSTVSLYQFRHDYSTFATDKSQYTEVVLPRYNSVSAPTESSVVVKDFPLPHM